MKKITYYVPLLLLAALGLVFNGCNKDGLHSITKTDSLSTDSINVLIKKATLSTVISDKVTSYMTVDKNGTVYFMAYDNTIYKVSGGAATTFYIPTSADTSHNTIMGLSVDSTGNVYTINRNSAAGTPASILKISPSGSASTFVSNLTLTSPNYYIFYLTVAANGDVFFEDIFGVIRKVSGGTATQIAQTQSAAQFAVDKNENVYFVGIETGVSTQYNISKVTAAGTTSVVVSSNKIKLSNIVEGLSVDKWGNLFVSDFGNNTIYGVDAKTNVYTITSNYGGDVDGPLATAKIYAPAFQGMDGAGNLYFYEVANSGGASDIRKITR